MNASSSTKAGEWLAGATRKLDSTGISTARLDCLVLLEDETGKDRGWLLAHPEFILQRSEIKNLSTKVAQRALHVPLAYIRGKAEFYGREFAVSEHTLVPRPETETMIELLIGLNTRPDTHILDVGTGSGCIAVTAALELPGSIVFACDIDAECLRIARQNTKRLKAKISFFESNLLERAEPADILLCNLPYVPDNFQINTAATHEPYHALFGGPDGLDLYRTLFQQIVSNAWKPRHILTESLPPQHEALKAIAKAAGYHLTKTDDFIQLFQRG
jgi:release factor glutamine methyltransferase